MFLNCFLKSVAKNKRVYYEKGCRIYFPYFKRKKRGNKQNWFSFFLIKTKSMFKSSLCSLQNWPFRTFNLCISKNCVFVKISSLSEKWNQIISVHKQSTGLTALCYRLVLMSKWWLWRTTSGTKASNHLQSCLLNFY